MRIEQLHQLGEVGEGPRETVHLVDDDDVELAGSHICQKPLEGGVVHGAAGESPVIVSITQADPAFVGLAFDIGLRGLPLGVK